MWLKPGEQMRVWYRTCGPLHVRRTCGGTHLEELLRPNRQPQSPRTLPQHPAGPGPTQPFPDGSTQPANCSMLPLCMHPIARMGIVGLARPSIREPHLRARRPTAARCKGRLADQAHLIKALVKRLSRLQPAPPPSRTPCNSFSIRMGHRHLLVRYVSTSLGRRPGCPENVSTAPSGPRQCQGRISYVALTSDGSGSRRRLPQTHA